MLFLCPPCDSVAISCWSFKSQSNPLFPRVRGTISALIGLTARTTQCESKCRQLDVHPEVFTKPGSQAADSIFTTPVNHVFPSTHSAPLSLSLLLDLTTSYHLLHAPISVCKDRKHKWSFRQILGLGVATWMSNCQ